MTAPLRLGMLGRREPSEVEVASPTPRRLRSAPMPPAVAEQVTDVLRRAHARDPFLPTDARSAAYRVAALLRDLDGLDDRPIVLRGSLDLGGAEVDHLFVVVAERVVDAAMPVHDHGFVQALRTWVAGDARREELATLAAALDIDRRVVGRFPSFLRYRGTPVWGATA